MGEALLLGANLYQLTPLKMMCEVKLCVSEEQGRAQGGCAHQLP